MSQRVARPSDTQPHGMTEAQARDCVDDLQVQSYQAYSFPIADGTYLIYCVDSDGKRTELSTVSEVEQYITRRRVAWMLKNGPTIMMGRE